jgi:exopolyphosphatase/guanosine-5'-triphosphate,3'-diphosphate pyrophosphatase
LDHRGRAATPGLEPGRVDVIVGGLLILVAVMDNFGFEGCLASEADILDGIAAGLLDTERR